MLRRTLPGAAAGCRRIAWRPGSEGGEPAGHDWRWELEPVDDARFDVIFCRNVLGDMEPSRRARVLAGLEQRLMDDGCLFLGMDERIEDDTIAFRTVQGRRGVYVKSPASLRRAA